MARVVFLTIRNVVLAAVVSDPDEDRFAILVKRYPRLLNGLTVLFALYLLFLLFLFGKLVAGWSDHGSFILTARTERIEYRPESIDPPRIALHNATLFWEEESGGQFDPLAPVSAESRRLVVRDNGSVQVQGRSTLVFSRIGQGELHIRVKSSQPVLVFNEREEQIAKLPPTADLVLNDPAAMLREGLSWKYNLDGPLIIGRVPSYGIQQFNGLLLEGEIQMVAKQLLSGNHYKVEPYKLQLGDEILFVPSTPKTSGLVTFDAERGLQVVAIVEADSATVKKFRETNLKITNNLWSRLGKDEELVITWAIVLTVPGMLVFLARLLTFHLRTFSKE